MKNLTDTFNGPSEPINFKSYLPGGSNYKMFDYSQYKVKSKGPNSSSNNAFNLTSGSGSFGGTRGLGDTQNQSPLGKTTRVTSNPISKITSYTVGGVANAGSSQARVNDISAVIKNKDIFEKAQ